MHTHVLSSVLQSIDFFSSFKNGVIIVGYAPSGRALVEVDIALRAAVGETLDSSREETRLQRKFTVSMIESLHLVRIVLVVSHAPINLLAFNWNTQQPLLSRVEWSRLDTVQLATVDLSLDK